MITYDARLGEYLLADGGIDRLSSTQIHRWAVFPCQESARVTDKLSQKC
jgi:hypothetical protein